ncbi:MAG: non-canonical purine NTP pyrophosphatase [Actinomycetota bacterium]|nr:non-canonical purine NTP pyrophosphatase [Actinomycetota bacterium]
MVVADDSGLEVDALDGRPGIYSSRFAGIKATDEENRKKLLECLEGVGKEDRGAQFVCSLVLWDPNKGLVFDTRGICRGKIGLTEKGEGGFGYDCLFIPEGYHKTMAELSADQKNRISHRGRALASFYRFIENF